MKSSLLGQLPLHIVRCALQVLPCALVSVYLNVLRPCRQGGRGELFQAMHPCHQYDPERRLHRHCLQRVVAGIQTHLGTRPGSLGRIRVLDV